MGWSFKTGHTVRYLCDSNFLLSPCILQMWMNVVRIKQIGVTHMPSARTPKGSTAVLAVWATGGRTMAASATVSWVI